MNERIRWVYEVKGTSECQVVADTGDKKIVVQCGKKIEKLINFQMEDGEMELRVVFLNKKSKPFKKFLYIV